MSVFTDGKEQRPENRVRRDKMKEILREAILNDNNLFNGNHAYLFGLEKKGLFICAFIITDPNEGDYDRTLIPGIDQELLFQAEMICSDAGGNLNRDCAIPVQGYHDGYTIECIVIEPRSVEEIDLFSKGYETACDALYKADHAPRIATTEQN